MEKLTLNSLERSTESKLKDLRQSSRIPWVIYGHNFNPSTISVDYSEFLKLFRTAWFTHIIKLTTGKTTQDVIVHDIQKHPVTWDFQHIDFMTINAKEKIHVKIPLKFIGSAPVTRDGWLVDQLMDEVDVKCLPNDLVDHFEFDISCLTELGQVAHFSELKIDAKKFEIHIDSETPIASVLEPRWIKVEDEINTPNPSEVPASTQKWEE